MAIVFIVVVFNEDHDTALLLESFLIKMKLLRCQDSAFTLEKKACFGNKICFFI